MTGAVEDFEEEGHEETDEESLLREENERQIAEMVVDALWQSQWTRGALRDYEYRGKGFDGLRQSFHLMLLESERPNIPAIKWKLEELVLRELQERQIDMYGHPKSDKRTIAAEDLYKSNKRLAQYLRPQSLGSLTQTRREQTLREYRQPMR